MYSWLQCDILCGTGTQYCTLQSSSNAGSARERSSSGIQLTQNAYSSSQLATTDKKTQHPSSVYTSHSGNRY